MVCIANFTTKAYEGAVCKSHWKTLLVLSERRRWEKGHLRWKVQRLEITPPGPKCSGVQDKRYTVRYLKISLA